jgi:hypothetical protein
MAVATSAEAGGQHEVRFKILVRLVNPTLTLWGKAVRPSETAPRFRRDMLLARLGTPALGTARQNTREAHRELVAHILDPAPDHVPESLPIDLMVRESCGG